jgi:hypothetical protein
MPHDPEYRGQIALRLNGLIEADVRSVDDPTGLG